MLLVRGCSLPLGNLRCSNQPHDRSCVLGCVVRGERGKVNEVALPLPQQGA